MTVHSAVSDLDAPKGSQLATDLAATIIEATSGWVVLLNGDLKILAASHAFCRAFGLDVGRVAGMGLLQLGVDELQAVELWEALEAALGGAQPASLAWFVERQDQATRQLVAHTERLACPGLPQAMILLSLEDVTDREAEASQAEAVRHSAALLLLEARHRISNGLQIVAGVLLQTARATVAEDARGHLLAASGRVMAVAALERQLSGGSDEAVDLQSYLTEICANITAASVSDLTRVSLRSILDPVIVNASTAASLGMIATELVINSLKHAFPGERAGVVTVIFDLDGANWVLTVADNGVGMPETVPKPGIGTDIVAALAKQLRATVTVTNAFPGKITSISYVESSSLRG